MHLAVGLAAWKIGGVEWSAPVLLRPLAIRRHNGDFELKLHGAFVMNPELRGRSARISVSRSTARPSRAWRTTRASSSRNRSSTTFAA